MAGQTTLKVEFSNPPEQVFDAFTNLREHGERYSGILSLCVLTDGPIGRGTRFRETRKVMGTKSEIEFIVSEFRQASLYEIVSENSPLTYKTTYTFVGRNGGTEVISEFTVAARRGWDAVATPILQALAWLMRPTLFQDLSDLKKIMANQV